MSRRISFILVLVSFVFLVPGSARAKDKKDKEQEKAYKQALSDFNNRYKSEDVQVRLAVVNRLVEFSDLGATKVVVEKVLGRERSGAVLDAAVRVVARTTDEKTVEAPFCLLSLCRARWRSSCHSRPSGA